MAAEILGPTAVRGASAGLARVLLTGRSLRDTATSPALSLIKAEVVKLLGPVRVGMAQAIDIDGSLH